MDAEERLNKALAAITPDRLVQLIRALSARQSPDTRSAVSLPAILEAVVGDVSLDEGPEGWRAQLAFKQAIRETVKGIPGMRYVEGDS